MKHEYQPLTERECFAIRAAYDGFGRCITDECNMTIRFKDSKGIFAVSYFDAVEYIRAWRKSGLWSLPGRASQDGGGE